jgi:hypothetical protein
MAQTNESRSQMTFQVKFLSAFSLQRVPRASEILEGIHATLSEPDVQQPKY